MKQNCEDITEKLEPFQAELVRETLAKHQRPLPSPPYYKIDLMTTECLHCKYYFPFAGEYYCNGVGKE